MDITGILEVIGQFCQIKHKSHPFENPVEGHQLPLSSQSSENKVPGFYWIQTLISFHQILCPSLALENQLTLKYLGSFLMSLIFSC